MPNTLKTQHSSDNPVLATLTSVFGLPSLRPGQHQVIQTLLDGRSALAIFPTGGGKSLCYQLPALLLDGLTLVISPLIALMKDQVDRLRTLRVPAARLDSTLSTEEVQAVGNQLASGTLRLLYVAPERLTSAWLMQHLKRRPPVLLALDEAHCISEWGHNFRPDYLKIARIAQQLGIPRVLALTATATPSVANDIRTHFQIRHEDVVTLGFHRPNLHLAVTPCPTEQKIPLMIERLHQHPGPTVIYVTRQETTEWVATRLNQAGFSARAYHAGLRQETRDDAQHAFMNGTTRIIVATIAFGMGIDKADIRAVYHYNLPKSLENYSQEIGRAGRDGLPAHCEMLCCHDDLTQLQNFIHADVPDSSALASLMDRILRQGPAVELSNYDLSVSCDIRQSVVATVLAYLELEGWIAAAGPPIPHRCKLSFPNGIDAALAGRSQLEIRIIRQCVAAGNVGRRWTTLDLNEVAAQGIAERETLIRHLQDLADAGDAVVEFSHAHTPYRLTQPNPPVGLLISTMIQRFQSRETADLKRLADVLALASQPGCLTDALTSYFGDPLERPCGHCTRCKGLPPTRIPVSMLPAPSESDWLSIRQLQRENHPALRSPRQLARFLCGMSSPAATRARLYQHDAFGLWSDRALSEVLTLLGHPSSG